MLKVKSKVNHVFLLKHMPSRGHPLSWSPVYLDSKLAKCKYSASSRVVNSEFGRGRRNQRIPRQVLVEPEGNLEADETGGEHGWRMLLRDIVRNFSVK